MSKLQSRNMPGVCVCCHLVVTPLGHEAPHFTVSVRAFLNKKFKDIDWPPRSPDLTICYFTLWVSSTWKKITENCCSCHISLQAFTNLCHHVQNFINTEIVFIKCANQCPDFWSSLFSLCVSLYILLDIDCNILKWK